MDRVKADELAAMLKGKTIDHWVVESLVNHGKSAAVFKATSVHDGQPAAVKIFDDELIAKYGDSSQLERIKRELNLVGKSHPNMVGILGGGFDQQTKNHYLVMQFIDGPNLKDCLQDVPIKHVPSLISQLASCCKFLESLCLAHRDIKPENIVLVEDLSRLILLDFGVVRPIGQGDVTDDDGVQAFVGTLQYSSPEFLLRNEKDDMEGWRALTFYQIGAVMHDLVMRKPIFSESLQPYARLVNAVQHDTPSIASSKYPSYLLETARVCLSKQAHLRTSLLDWRSFNPPEDEANTLEGLRDRVSKRSVANAPETDGEAEQRDQKASLLDDAISHLKVKIRSVRNSNRAAFPPTTIVREQNTLVVDFGPSQPHGLDGRLRICYRIEVLDAAATLIRMEAACVLAHQQIEGPRSWATIHQGLSSGVTFLGSVEASLYLAMDRAQQIDSYNDRIEIDLTDAN